MPTPRPVRRALAAVALGTLAATALTACGDDGDEKSSGGSGGSDSGVSQIAVTLTSADGADACQLDVDSAEAGPVTFTVTNKDAAGISEVELLQGLQILGEKENLAPGLAPVSFTTTLDGGHYEIYCPGAATDKVPFTVTGAAAPEPTGDTQALLQEGATEYGAYVADQVTGMVDGVTKLQAAVDAGDLEEAQKAYANARPFYEKIESDVDGFLLPGTAPDDNSGNLDYLVDMRASNLDEKVGWHGFHAVERDLFEAKKITDDTKALAAELTENVTKLADLSADLTYKPEDLANGAAGLLEEVQNGKIGGEEELYSHIDLVDFAANVEGAQQCFAFLENGLKKLDADMVTTVGKRFEDVTSLLDTYRDNSSLGGYRLYTPELRDSDGAKLSKSVQALQDSLSRLAEKVATA